MVAGFTESFEVPAAEVKAFSLPLQLQFWKEIKTRPVANIIAVLVTKI
jgi:hypothetical protein